MKIRFDFVTNSSSSSFIIMKKLTNEQLKKIFKNSITENEDLDNGGYFAAINENNNLEISMSYDNDESENVYNDLKDEYDLLESDISTADLPEKEYNEMLKKAPKYKDINE